MKANNVGIECLEIYFPKVYVNQAELEIHDNVSKGKYTIGLGQNNMAFVYNYEDVNSMALTVVHNLLSKYNIDPKSIGRLEVGTETLIDKSKSTKTVLMRLFEQNDIEGITSINACYGGTNALFNTIQWMQSDVWDGRLGIVVCVDVAVYAKGPARPTGGAGAIALLIAPNATFVMERERSTFMKDVYDFYKPNLNSEYPLVDGQLSINTYLQSIDYCCQKYQGSREFDYFCFHSPYNKMVQKSYARLIANFKQPEQWQEKALPCCLLSKELGNIYTGSLYAGLISLIENKDDLLNKRICMFSYGSGCAASLFVLKCTKSTKQLKQIQQIQFRLNQRIKIDPLIYEQHLQYKQDNFNKHSMNLEIDPIKLFDKTYYLSSIDDKWRRIYQLFNSSSIQSNPTSNIVERRIEQIGQQIIQDTSQQRKQYNQIWAGFYKKTLQQRLDQIGKICNINVDHFKDGGLSLQNANLMIENCIGKLSMPIGLGLNFQINNQLYTIPMCIEEPSVIAAASSAAKTIADAGNGFQVYSTRPVMMGQIQLLDIPNYSVLECLIDSNKKTIINRGNQVCQSMVKRGGGIEDVKIRQLGEGQASVDVFVNVCDSMGANIVNTVLEYMAPLIEEITNCRIGIKILTNLCLQRKVTAQIKLDINQLNYRDKTGFEVAKLIVEAYKFAELDLYRAVTHNKGIINGIEAVCNATGQDTRAVSASIHGYASLGAKYSPLSKFSIDKDYLIGELTVPISVGSQGGVIHQNPVYQQVLQILEYPDSQKLSEIIVCVGLASNFAALRALAVEGIQKGHMNLHARNLAIASGIPDHLVEDAVKYMKNRNSFKKETASEFLKAFNVYQEIGKAKGKQLKNLCTFSGQFNLEGSEESVDLHVVFDCHSQQPIDLNFSKQSEINDKIFGKKGSSWLKNLFSVINLVRLDESYEVYSKKNLTVKLKLLSVLVDLLSSNMLALDTEKTSRFINQFLQNTSHQLEEGDISLRYGLALMSELIHIFEYNIDQFIGNPQLRKALIQELYTIIRSNVRCYELWELGKKGEFHSEEFLFCRKKRLSCTMMLLCECINVKQVDQEMINLVHLLGDIYEIEITITRDMQKFKDSTLRDPNLYTYWLMQHDRVLSGDNNCLQDQFRNEAIGMLELKRQQVPQSMRYLSDQVNKAVKTLYKPKL